MLKFHVRLTPTKEELADGIRRGAPRRAGPVRLIAQTIALVLVAAWSLVAYFGGGREEAMSAVIGIAALVLIPVMWLVPCWQASSLAQAMADSGSTVKIWVFENGVDFGEEPPEYAYHTFQSFFVSLPTEKTEQTMVMTFPNDEIVVVPKSNLTDEQWAFLVEKVSAAPAEKTDTW